MSVVEAVVAVFSHTRILEKLRRIIRRLCFFVVVVKVEIARGHPCNSSGQDQSTVAQRAETTVDERSLTSFV